MREYAGSSTVDGEPAPSEWRADLSGAAILLQRSQFMPDDDTARLSELARVALATKRRARPGTENYTILPDQTRDLLRFKLDDPMLGIYGGHLLLLESVPDLSLLTQVVRNLRALVGRSHPDVEALALRTELSREVVHIEDPPMLRRSWGIIAEESVRRPGLISDSLISGPAPLLWPEDPWHIWQTSQTLESSPDPELSELEEAVAERLGISSRLRRALRDQARGPSPKHKADRPGRRGDRNVSSRSMDFGFDEAKSRSATPRRQTISVALKTEDMGIAARQFGLPREQLERVIGRLQHKLNRSQASIDVDVKLPDRSGAGPS
jgi:hypothetical protein